jgi:hypothetical protein
VRLLVLDLANGEVLFAEGVGLPLRRLVVLAGLEAENALVELLRRGQVADLDRDALNPHVHQSLREKRRPPAGSLDREKAIAVVA